MTGACPGTGAPIARRPRPGELRLALALLDRDLAGSALRERAREVCAQAFAALGEGARRDAEHRALVAARDAGAGLAGVVLFGEWAGTVGGARLYALAGDEEASAVLLGAARDACRASRARYLLAELPDEPALRPTLERLRRAGFAEAGRVADLVRDGVDLVMLSLTL